VRLGVLLVALAAVAVYGVPRIIRNASASAGGVVCPSAPATLRLPDSRFRIMLQASALDSLTGGGTADTQGWQEPSAAWSDSPPADVAVGDSAIVDAGYELRWFSAQGHELAGLFVFASPAAARRYVAKASGVSCHAKAVAYSVPRPRGARALIWTNPVQARQADLFFARGVTVYRLAVVPPAGGSAGRDRRDLVHIDQRLACQLGAAGCPSG
jgi:hypothetical protein